MASNYFKYNFVSPEPVFALVKEELKSYFDTGAVDDTLFPIWTNKCLNKLGKGSYKIRETLLRIKDFKGRLPDNFKGVREAWLCAAYDISIQHPSARYTQVVQTSTRIDNPDVFCKLCEECENPDIVQAIYKTTNEVLYQFRRTYLLKPANINTNHECELECANIGIEAQESYDIRDNNFVVTFREGIVHLVYYSYETTEEGYQLIPENVRIQEYIESYIKYKTFEQLYNQVTDETYNQIEKKYETYKAEQYEKKILAETEMKKQTTWQKRQSTRRLHRRFKYYRIH